MMATFVNRPTGTLARIRKHGFPAVSKTFKTKTAARAWANKTEDAMDSGAWLADEEATTITVAQMFDQWQAYIHPIKPFCKTKLSSIEFLKLHFGSCSLAEVTPKLVMDFGAKRRQNVARATLQKELSYFAQAVDFGVTMFDLPIKGNPVREATRAMAQIGMTGGGRQLERRLNKGEFERLISAASHRASRWMVPVIEVAVHTAMRRGEIHGLRWSDLDFEAGTIFIRDRKHPTEKIGNDQTIPMFPPARSAFLVARKYSKCDNAVFPVKTAKAITAAFTRIKNDAGIDDLRFHDLRHEGVSRLFERGWTIPQVAAVSGHRDWAQLKRYTQLKPGELLENYERAN